jgi:cytochrome c-type biogenesis protein CcmH/NrfG
VTQSPIVGTRGTPPVNRVPPGGEAPLQDVLVELWQNLEKLVRQELVLASAELDVKVQKLKRELAAIAIGAGLMLAGMLALVAAVILVLALVMPPWAAALISGAVAAGAGFGVVQAKKPSVSDMTPERTIQNLKKDLQTFTESTK